MAQRDQLGIEKGVEKGIPAQQLESVDDTTAISEAHREYLIERHGTAELDPLPDMNDANPLNWPKYKKVINLSLVAFHGMMSTFTAAAIQSAFHNISLDLNVSIQKASYLTSLVIVILGAAPLFWRPLADRFGRRPIFLISLLGSLIGNIGCAKSPSYGTMGLCRAITAFFICPASAIGSAVVSECFFKHQRARYMGIWTLLVTLGVPTAPFIFGFVALRVGYRWIYWILAITNAVQFILYLFLGPETRYVRETGKTNRLFQFRRIEPRPLKLWDFLHPLILALKPSVLLPAVAYSMIFAFASVLISIEIPQIFVEAFGFNTQQVGLQNISLIVGSLIGEIFGGFLSDRWMLLQKSRTSSPKPEFRLWLGYVGELFAIGGTVMFLVCLQKAGTHWNVSPLIGAGLAAGGNQLVTTVMITYAVDCHQQDTAAVGAFITFVRQTWGFIGPFWYPNMIANIGLNASAGLVTALMVCFSILPTIALQLRGRSLRKIDV